jgi:hypothetical protein
MAQLTTRTTSAPGATAKGSPLTNAEVDQNFNRLNKAGPQIRPSLLLDFANSESVDNRITFNRASAATRYDSNGVLQTLRNDKPRIDFDPVTGECKGLLIEEQRTNLLSNSSRFDKWTSYRNYLRPNAGIAPDGTKTAYRNSSASATIDGGGVFQTSTFTFASATTYTLSIYAKADGATSLSIGFTDQSAGGYAGGAAFFDLALQSSPTFNGRSNSASIVDVDNGWRRVSVTFTTKTSPDFHYVFVNIVPTGTDANGVYLWGAQLEQGGFATSYTPNSESFTTRNSSATYFDSAGVLRTAGPNQARYGYGYDSDSGKWISQGLILEPAATNLVIRSDMQANWGIPNAGYTYSTQTTAPDGSTINSINKNSTYQLLRLGGVIDPGTISYPVTYTFSFWAKTLSGAGTLTWDIGDSPTIANNFNASAALTTTWQRFTYTFTATSSAAFPYGGFIDFTIPDNSTFAIWGVQLETGAVATSLIPTYGSTATRAADISSSAAATRAADNLAMDFSRLAKTKGFTVAGEAEAFGGQSGRIIALAPTSSDTSNIFSVNFEPANFRTYQYSGGALRFNTAGAGYLANTFLKFALGVSGSAFSTVVNGYRESGTGAVEMQTDHLRIGSMNPGQYYLSGHIKRLAYFPQKLSDNELTAFTQ